MIRTFKTPPHAVATALFATSLLAAGCTGPKGRGDLALAPSGSVNTYYGTETGITKCPLSRPDDEGPFAAIISSLIASTVQVGVERIGTALKEAAKEHTSKVQAERNVLIRQGDLECVTIVRGWFYRDPLASSSEGGPTNQELGEARFPLDGLINKVDHFRLWNAGLWVADQPDFAFEGQFAAIQAGDGQPTDTYSLLPRVAILNETAESRFLRSDSERFVSVFLGFEDVAASLDVKANPGATIILGKLRQAEPVTWPLEEQPAQPAANVVDPVGIGKDNYNINRLPWESEMFKLTLGDAPKPLRLKVLVTETQGESQFLSFVSAVFAKSQTTIATELTNLADPAKRAEAEAAAEKAQLTALDKAATQRANVISKLIACGNGTKGYASLAAEVHKAMRAYDAARGAIGERPLFTAVDYAAIPIATEASGAATKAGCTAALGKFST